MNKKDSVVSCVIFDEVLTKYHKYDGDMAVIVDNWIQDMEDVKTYIRAILSITDELHIPEELIETYFNCSRNLLNIIDNG